MKKMLNFFLIASVIAAVLIVVAFVGCNKTKSSIGTGEAANTASIKIDIASLYTEGTVCDEACLRLTKLLNDSGLFTVTYYNNSQLGSLYDQIESLIAGAPIIALGGGSDWGDRVGVPLMGVVMTPFLYDKLDDVYGVTHADYWKDMLKDAEKAGVKILNAPIVSGSRYFMGNKKYGTPTDFEGQKIRVPNSSAYLNAFEAFHASPVPIPFADLYTSLSQKLVDGLEQPYANAYSAQFHEVVKYSADIPYATTFDFYGLNLSLWNNMSNAHKKAMEKALADVCEYSFKIFEDIEKDGRNKLAEKGMEFYTPDVGQFRNCLPKYYELCGWTDEFKQKVENGMKTHRNSK